MKITTENHNSHHCEVPMTNNTTARYLPPHNFNSEAKYDNFTISVVHLLVLIAIAVLSPVAVVANALVLAAIWRNLSLRTTSYILLAGLAFTDFCTGLISQPIWIVKHLIKLENFQFNSAHQTKLPTSYWMTEALSDRCIAYFFQSTVSLITLMSIERWLLMSRRSLLTVRRISFIVAVLLLLMLPLAIFLRVVEISSLAMFCVLVTSAAYFKVFRIIRRHQQQIQASMSFQNAVQPAINFVKYKKSVYTILYILCAFYLGYVPLIITMSLLLIFAPVNLHLVTLLVDISVLLIFLSSSMNPLIVLWRMKDIRDEVTKLLKQIFCKNNQAP